jgi:hypothetical protein
MANRFPLIVNPTSKKIEELSATDNLDLTNSGIVANNTSGTNGQYLKTNGSTVVWDNPGDVYLTTSQTITNKTFNDCVLSGSTNTFSAIPNNSLVNNKITVNSVDIPLGGSVTTPDNNTTYAISAQDGGTSTEKIIRLTSGGNAGAGINDDVTLVAGSNVTLSRTGDAITINSSYIDTNTITRLQSSTGGTLVSGDITIAAGGSSTVSQAGNTITISSSYVDTITRLRGTASGTYTSGDLTLLSDGATTVTQSGSNYTISSVNTITRLQSSIGGTLTSGDISIAGSGATSVSQSGSTITINSTDTNTITRLQSATAGTLTSGDITIAAGGASVVSQSGGTITITSTDTNTTYSVSSTGGLAETSTVFSLKNVVNLTDSRLLKWDNSNKQLVNSIISDNGSVVTINGALTVTGSVTTIDTTTLVVADNEIELRKGNNLVGTDSGIKINRTTNASGLVQTYNILQWFESGGYWRSYDGSVANRFVTETETQTLTNKTLSNPILTTPTLGAATATTINGLAITQVSNGTLTIANSKTLTCNNTLTFSGTDSSTIGFGTGGTVVYTTNNLSVFASTTSAQLRGVLSDETGVGVAVFGTSPTITTSILTGSTTFAVFNTTATTINAFGAATAVNIGATTGTTTIRNSLSVNGTTNLGDVVGDAINLNGTVDFVNADFTIRGGTANPIAIGRGGNAIATNTRMGYNCLNSNTSGSQNTAIGFEAAKTINSGASIVAIGYQALTNASTGQHNIAIGRSALTAILGGERNVGVGSNTLEGNTTGNNNVAIGYYAGGGATGSGNVLIGPAPDGNSTNVTYTPPTPSGDNQLVIGSGTATWVRGDSNFDVTLPQNANVGGNLTVSGNLVVNGTTTSINTNILSVDDKLIDLADISARTFTASIVSNSANITAITPVTGLIPGMVVSISTAGLSVPAGTTIVSITNNTATLSNTVTGSSGTATFVSTGATDTTADGGGFRVKGTTDKSITYVNATTAFTSTEHFDLATGKQYRIGNVQVANGLTTTLGPTTGSWSIGAGVTTSSLTQVGTLSSLTVSGNLTVDTNTLFVDATNNRVGILNTSPQDALHVQGIFRIDRQLTAQDQSYMRFTRQGTGKIRMGLKTDDAFFINADDSDGSNHFLVSSTEVYSSNNFRFAAGKGIDFSANANNAGMTSELLSDYEEGTWTPNQGGGLTVTGTFSSSGTYTKIGRQVFITFTLSGSTSIAIGGAGGTITSNLPFAAPSYFGVIYVGTSNVGFGIAGGNSSTVYSGGSVTGNSTITFSATYYTT